jgi:hypothetical protein
VAGLVFMVVALSAAGIGEGRLWGAGEPWVSSLEASRPFWVARAHAGVLVAAGLIALLAGLTTGPRGAGMAIRPAEDDGSTLVAPRLAGVPDAIGELS